MDLLSDVLSFMRPESYVSGAYRVPPHTTVHFPQRVGMKCYAVLSGSCWLAVEGADQVKISTGDCYILPHGRPFHLSTDLTATAVEYTDLKARHQWDITQPTQGDPSAETGCLLIGGHFVLSGLQSELLLRSLPFVVHIREEAGKSAMLSSLNRMKEEVSEGRPGSALVVQQLAYAMLIQALRLYLDQERDSGSGWLFALTDKHLSQALTSIHEHPARAWTLSELATSVGMSRSAFALRFKQVVGASPMEYLTRWRMLLASRRLVHPGVLLSDLASSLGYESESAFAKAFKRVIGCSPREFRKSKSEPVSSPA